MDYSTINNETDRVMRLTLRDKKKRTELKQKQKKNKNIFSPSKDLKKIHHGLVSHAKIKNII
jgi:hypothetical protein